MGRATIARKQHEVCEIPVCRVFNPPSFFHSWEVNSLACDTSQGALTIFCFAGASSIRASRILWLALGRIRRPAPLPVADLESGNGIYGRVLDHVRARGWTAGPTL